MLIAVDVGNTRLKWACHDGQRWSAVQALPTHAPDTGAQLAAALRGLPAGSAVVACNVAGAPVAAGVETALVQAGLPPPRWLRPSRDACGVHNTYATPERLGADRWAALLGARALGAGPCLVICAGTATTIDRLTADGDFLGGVILPGFDLMRRALAGNTAQLPFSAGEISITPRNTADAIASGCLFAQLGAIERLYAPLAAESGAHCLLTGGAAALLMTHLSVPCRQVDTLIFEGLRCFAEGAGTGV